MRISDWSSDVCSSDLFDLVAIARLLGAQHRSNSLDRLPRIAPLALHSRLIDWINVRNAVNHFGLLGMEFVGANITKADNRAVLYHDRVEAILGIGAFRSEEHTSELQSLMRISYAVFCMKKNQHRHENYTQTLSHTNYLQC